MSQLENLWYEKSQIYHKPIEISESSTLKAKYIWKSGYVSKVNEAHFVRPEPRLNIPKSVSDKQRLSSLRKKYGIEMSIVQEIIRECQ